MRPLRYSINVTLDGCCDHRAIIPDEELHRHAVENLNRADALLFGRVTYEMMEAAFRSPGRVGDRPVRCLSADAQVQCHAQGYEPTEKDLHDMERLQECFGVALPVNLCRQRDGDSKPAAQSIAADATKATRR